MSLLRDSGFYASRHSGRLTNQQLAEIAGLSASQCSRRRMRLEEDKVMPLKGAAR